MPSERMIGRPVRSGTFLFYWLPVILYCAAIFAQSALPSPDSLPAFPGADKLLHAAAYAVLGILFFRAYRTTQNGGNLNRVAVISILFALCYCISDEIHQFFVAERDGDVMDVVADAAGAVIGVGWIRFLAARAGKKHAPF